MEAGWPTYEELIVKITVQGTALIGLSCGVVGLLALTHVRSKNLVRSDQTQQIAQIPSDHYELSKPVLRRAELTRSGSRAKSLVDPGRPPTFIQSSSSDLTIAGGVSPNPVSLGSDVTYSTAITNKGPNVASVTTFVTTLPSSTNIVSVSTTQGACSRNNNAGLEITKIEIPFSRLPDRFPQDIPIEEPSNSVTQNYLAAANDGRFQATRVFDTTRTLDDAAAIYQTYFTARAWTINDVYSGQGYKGVLATKNGMSINAFANENSITHLRHISLDLTSAGAICSLGDLSVGSNVTIATVVRPSANGILTNIANAFSNATDPNMADNLVSLDAYVGITPPSPTPTPTPIATPTPVSTPTPSASPISETVAYTYDGLNRLTGVAYSSGPSINYSYDAAGNRAALQMSGVRISVGTSTGSNVIAQGNGIAASFTNVTASGITSIDSTNLSFVGLLPNGFQLFSDSAAFNLSTTATFQGSVGVCFNGSFNTDSLTFARLRVFHNENGVWINRTLTSDLASRTVCSNVSSLGQFAIALLGPPTPLLDSASNRAAALNSVTTLRDPVTIIDTHNFSVDQRARFAFFVQSVDLLPAENKSLVTAEAVDSQNVTYTLPIEAVAKVPNMDWLTEVIVKLPDALIGRGDVQVSVTVRGIKSEKVTLRVQ